MKKPLFFASLASLALTSGSALHARQGDHYLHIFITEGDRKVATRRVWKENGETLKIKTNGKFGVMDILATPKARGPYTEVEWDFDYRGKNRSNKLSGSRILKLRKNVPENFSYSVPYGNGKSKSQINIKIFVK